MMSLTGVADNEISAKQNFLFKANSILHLDAPDKNAKSFRQVHAIRLKESENCIQSGTAGLYEFSLRYFNKHGVLISYIARTSLKDSFSQLSETIASIRTNAFANDARARLDNTTQKISVLHSIIPSKRQTLERLRRRRALSRAFAASIACWDALQASYGTFCFVPSHGRFTVES